jgi:ABC-type transporter Mla subunit MlaD
LANENSQF